MGRVFDTIWQSKNLRSARVKMLLNTFESVKGLEQWTPARHEWMRVLFWAIVLEKTCQEPTLAELIKDFSKAVLEKNKPKPDVMSELSGAAFLVSLGWNVEKIERTEQRTPDFNATKDEKRFSFEVTKPRPKVEQVELFEYGSALSGKIAKPARKHDIIVMLASVLDPDEEDELKQAINQLDTGQCVERFGYWKVLAKPMESVAKDRFKLGDEFELPTWWPAKFEQSPIKVSGTYTFEGGPRSVVACATVIKGYLNALKKKAGHFQGFGTQATVIGVDTGNLPGAFAELEEELPKRFQKWRHIAGVLAYESHLEPKRIGWKVRMFANPVAVLPSPILLPAKATLFSDNIFQCP